MGKENPVAEVALVLMDYALLPGPGVSTASNTPVKLFSQWDYAVFSGVQICM